jgi:coronin-1B/1C/6
MARFVRSSKYRHVFGTGAKQEFLYENVRVSKSAWDTNKVTASTKYIGVCWEAGGGGQFAVIDRNQPGKLPANFPLVSGHKAPVLDLDFSPFNPNVIASVGEDGYGYIWSIPEGGLQKNLDVADVAQTLKGHRRKVGTVSWHPSAENILTTSSTDFTVKVWDVTKGAVTADIAGHTDNIGSVAWNYDGSKLATASKDKKARLIDPRTGEIVKEFPAHDGNKGSRCIWLGNKDWILTVGLNRTSEREFRIWDVRDLSKQLAFKSVDTAAGQLMPFYDNDSAMLYLAGKGDGNIRYFELTDDAPFFHFLAEYKSAQPQIGCGMLPKLAVNVGECEIAVLLKATPSAIEPISFKVPRKSDLFQDDLFPPTAGEEPALSAAEWLSGKNATPKLVSLEAGYVAPKNKPLVVEKVEEVPEKELTPLEMKNRIAELENRVSYLEAEIAKKDLKIRELSG